VNDYDIDVVASASISANCSCYRVHRDLVCIVHAHVVLVFGFEISVCNWRATACGDELFCRERTKEVNIVDATSLILGIAGHYNLDIVWKEPLVEQDV